MKRATAITALLAAALPLAGCGGVQSALDPQGRESSEIAWLIWLFTGVSAVIWLAVMAALVIGFLRRETDPAESPLSPRDDRTRIAAVTAAVALTAITVIGLTVLSYRTDKSLAAPGAGPVTLRVISHQWWWEVRYEDPAPSRNFTTANEIKVPVGVPVRLKLQSDDVIHSIWVPNLAGKQDLIPGWTNAMTFTANAPGKYRGQCAEFCGFQHAHMAVWVEAVSFEEFDRWTKQQIAAAAPPAAENKEGERIFMTSGCILCHAVRGTTAGGKTGPDLTHLASRETLAAGTLDNSHDNLEAWIADPQGIKPGANMPRVKLTADQREKLVRYLEGLK
jgi:cytochrome c oxidase subunit II